MMFEVLAKGSLAAKLTNFHDIDEPFISDVSTFISSSLVSIITFLLLFVVIYFYRKSRPCYSIKRIEKKYQNNRISNKHLLASLSALVEQAIFKSKIKYFCLDKDKDVKRFRRDLEKTRFGSSIVTQQDCFDLLRNAKSLIKRAHGL